MQEWQGPERIRTLLWLVVHKRLLTNNNKVTRHMAINHGCHCYLSVVETLLHVLRDCGVSNETWLHLERTYNRPSFFGANLLSWLMNNLSSKEVTCEGWSWAMVFGVTLWT